MINDDTLLLFYFDELGEVERRDVQAALERTEPLAQRYAALVADLERLRDAPNPRVPRTAEAAWHDALSTAATPRAARTRWLIPGLAAAAGIGILALGVAIGLRVGVEPAALPLQADRQAVPDARTSPDLKAIQPSAAFSRGLVGYMQAARVQLTDLDPVDESSRAAIIAEIVAHNRAFERAAKERGAHDIARVLRAFEQTLQQLAGDTTLPDDRRRRIQQLRFEYGAMLTRIAPQVSNQPYTL